MDFNSMFRPKQKSLARQKSQNNRTFRSGQLEISWPETPKQQPKDYKVITTEEELLEYLNRCKETGLCSFDWETGPSEEEEMRWENEVGEIMDKRDQIEENIKLATSAAQVKALNKMLKEHDKYFEEREEYHKESPLDPHRADICTVSLSAAPHEARVLFLSHDEGSQYYFKELDQEDARMNFMQHFEKEILRNKDVEKIAYNLNFETKMAMKYGIYIGKPAIDPFVLITRTLQVVNPKEIEDPKMPAKGKGLKQMTLKYLKVKMNEFTAVVEDSGHDFFNEMSTDDPNALIYSAEDSDYSLQLYLFFKQIAEQVKIERSIVKAGSNSSVIDKNGNEIELEPIHVYDKPYGTYYEWLKEIEMPFARVIGQMEYHGFTWNEEKAEKTKALAVDKMEQARNRISEIGQIAYKSIEKTYENIIKQKVGETFYDQYLLYEKHLKANTLHELSEEKDLYELSKKDDIDIEILKDLISRKNKKLNSLSRIKSIDPGKTGKNTEVRFLLFDVLGCPVPNVSEKTGKPNMDHNSILDMKFMVNHNLTTLDDEKYVDIDINNPDIDHSVKQRAQEILNSNPYEYKNEILDLLNEIENVQKFGVLLSSHIIGREKFVNPMTGRIHARFTPWTETSRLNSSKPNGQNVPRPDTDEFGIRNVYQAAPGKVLLLIDYSGFELRLMAWASKDENMLDIFNNDGDMHRRTAATLTGKKEEDITKEERISAKSGNFGIGYCGTAWALQRTYKRFGNRKSIEFCEKVVNAVKSTYPKIAAWQIECASQSRRTGYAETIFGYRRMLPYINSMNNRYRSSDERRASNTPIQGSAADIMKKAQNAIYDRIAQDTWHEKYDGIDSLFVHGRVDQIQQFHDELVLEVDDDLETIKAVVEWTVNKMQEDPIPNFPLKLIAEPEIAVKGWGDKEDYYKWLEKQGENDE